MTVEFGQKGVLVGGVLISFLRFIGIVSKKGVERMVMGNALWQLIKQSDSVSQLVLLALLGMSIACWSIFFYKWWLFRAKKRQLAAAVAQLKMVQNLEQLLEVAPQFSGTMPGYFISRNLSALKGVLEVNKQGEHTPIAKQQWDLIEQSMGQTIDEMLVREEELLPVLAASAAVSPLLGLFGTVWGLIHAFVRISEKQSADIATVAPGIAEALITTLAGLIVAIPALMMFSYLNAQLKTIEHRLVTMADRCSLILQKSRDLWYWSAEAPVHNKMQQGGDHATF
jgi:biopolymer transport protein TolQ